MENVIYNFNCKTVQDSGRETESERRYENQFCDISFFDNQAVVNGASENKEQKSLVQYRTKITSDGRIVRVILSDGETSSGIDSVSSVGSINDFNSNETNTLMRNVLVEVKNEIALKHPESDSMKTIKKVSIHQQKFSKSLEENDNIPTHFEFFEKTDESSKFYEEQQDNVQRSEKSESKVSSNQSDDRISKKSKKSRRSKSFKRSRRRSSKRSKSSDRSSSDRERFSSHERKRSKNSSRRKDRSSSERSRSLSRRRRRSSSERSRSLSRRRRRSSSRKSRSLSGKKDRSSSSSRSLTRRKSRSLSKRRSRSATKKSSKWRSRTRRRSRSYEENFTSYERRESESIEEASSSSYYSKTETRKRGFFHGGFHSTTIHVHSGYFPHVIDRGHYYWRNDHRSPRSYVRGVHRPSVKRHHTELPVEEYSREPKFQKKSDVEESKCDPPASSSREGGSRDASQEENQTKILSQVNATFSTSTVKVVSDTEERTVPEPPRITSYDSSEEPNHRPSLPKVGVDNLPLVPGPNGLPVHITKSGRKIPYDMDGRRIPIGPNGHHLPLDVTGRLFPHVITLDNNAVPIYLSEDGVLRLPDSRPVPFGSPHKLPVDIDGKMILIGPDSRPLIPRPNLPTRPPEYVIPDEKKPSIVISSTENASQQNNSSDHQTNEQSETNQRSSNSEVDIEELNPSEARSIDSESDSDYTYFAQLLQKPVETTPVPPICSDSLLKKVLDTTDENLLKKVQELTKEKEREQQKKSLDDHLVNKIKTVLKTLYESNYQPPQFGRFIVPSVMFEPSNGSKGEFVSPLWRNRIRLPFITPGMVEKCETKETTVTYKFESKGNYKVLEKNEDEEVQILEEYTGKDMRLRKPKTSTLGVQCDFTTEMINESNLAVSKLKKEVVSLQNAYQTLFEMYERACAKVGTAPESME